MHIGLARDVVAGQGWTLSADEAKQALGKPDIALIDLREDQERRRDGVIPGSLHVPYPDVEGSLKADGLLYQLGKGGGRRLIFYCTFGQRSAMAVQAAQAAGLTMSRHLQGGIRAWQHAEGPLAR
jgi:rhodanese-related sulfurtransferase